MAVSFLEWFAGSFSSELFSKEDHIINWFAGILNIRQGSVVSEDEARASAKRQPQPRRAQISSFRDKVPDEADVYLQSRGVAV